MTTSDNKAHCAAFVLREALALNICVGTDGNELVMLAPMRVSIETREWFYRQLYELKSEVIDIILRKNAGGGS